MNMIRRLIVFKCVGERDSRITWKGVEISEAAAAAAAALIGSSSSGGGGGGGGGIGSSV